MLSSHSYVSKKVIFKKYVEECAKGLSPPTIKRAGRYYCYSENMHH